MADVTKVKLGVCSVTFNGVDLGHTIGGVEVSYEPEYHDTAVDLYGNTIVESWLIGEKFSAKVPLAEFTIANLAVAIPQGVTTGSTKHTMGAKAGKKSTVDAHPLVLHPIANAAGDRSEDVVFYKAIVINAITLAHKNEDEKIIEVEFLGLLDETKADGNYLGLIGDSTT